MNNFLHTVFGLAILAGVGYAVFSEEGDSVLLDAADAPDYIFSLYTDLEHVSNIANHTTKWRDSEYINELLATSDQDAVDIFYAGRAGWPKVQARFEERAKPYKEAFMADYYERIAAYDDFLSLPYLGSRPFDFSFPSSRWYKWEWTVVDEDYLNPDYRKEKVLFVGDGAQGDWIARNGTYNRQTDEWIGPDEKYNPKTFAPDNHPKLIYRALELAAQAKGETDCEIGWAFGTPNRNIVGIKPKDRRGEPREALWHDGVTNDTPFFEVKRYEHPNGFWRTRYSRQELVRAPARYLVERVHSPHSYDEHKIWDAAEIYYQFPVANMFRQLKAEMLSAAKRAGKRLDALTLEALNTEVIYFRLTYGRFGKNWVLMDTKAYTEDGDWEGHEPGPSFTPRQAMKERERRKPAHRKPVYPCDWVRATALRRILPDEPRKPKSYPYVHLAQEAIPLDNYRPLITSNGLIAGGGEVRGVISFGTDTASTSYAINIANPAPIGVVNAGMATK